MIRGFLKQERKLIQHDEFWSTWLRPTCNDPRLLMGAQSRIIEWLIANPDSPKVSAYATLLKQMNEDPDNDLLINAANQIWETMTEHERSLISSLTRPGSFDSGYTLLNRAIQEEFSKKRR